MKKLRTRLTLLYTMTTGGIFLFVMVMFLVSSVRNAQKTQLDQFRVIWNSLASRFLSADALSHSYLSQTEADCHMIIHIRENGVPFLYQGSWQPDTDRETLIRLAREQAAAENVFMDHAPLSSSSATSSLMTINGENGDRYYAMILSLASKNGVKSLCAVSSILPVWETLGETIFLLCSLTVAGPLVLWLISWNFVGWSLKPVEESRQRQTRFIAAASHELRSPLAVLQSAVSRLSVAPDEKDTLLPLLDSECVRMSRLVDDMLFLASTDAGAWSLHLTEVDMDTLLIDLFESFRPLCRNKGISLHLELSDEIFPKIQGDPQRLRQLLLILLDNAADHAPLDSSVWLRAFTDRDRPDFLPSLKEKNLSGQKNTLILQVEDQGCGIPDQNKPYIFDRFYRGDQARSDKQHFGLGLAIARELAELHGGRILVRDGKDRGTCFSVLIPY